MKKYYSVISSIVTAVIMYIAVLLNRRIEAYKVDTFDIKGSMIYEALIIFAVGVCVGWNLWMLYKAEKRTIALTVSILISIILMAVMYRYLFEGILYPIVLIGAYGFGLVNKLFSKKS